MTGKRTYLAEKLIQDGTLAGSEYAALLAGRNEEAAGLLADRAREIKERYYGHDIFVRGLIEFTNCCRNDCLYCGIRRSNRNCDRYRLTRDEILSCCQSGYELGFRTFVLQGGEDPYFTDERLVLIVREIRLHFPDCAITLSVGERSKESYQALFDAGAERFLLRHETADEEHYRKLHPGDMSFSNRMQRLRDLKEIGYQTGCGFMVGSPYQTYECLAKDLLFIEDFRPEMCGIGPFIPHMDTPFAGFENSTVPNSVELTCFLLSIIRIIHPKVLLPATTALATIDPRGREKGILSGANVVMPNLSPGEVRDKYMLYDNKACTGEEAAECRDCLKRRMESIGSRIVTARGDYPREL